MVGFLIGPAIVGFGARRDSRAGPRAVALVIAYRKLVPERPLTGPEARRPR